MNVITKKIAKSLGYFSVISVTPTENPNLSCPLCSKQIDGHFAVFDCDHYSCTECLDRLVDAQIVVFGDDETVKETVEETADTPETTLFVCPVCSHEVKNIEYK